MKLKEFMEMLKDSAVYTKGKKQSEGVTATSCTPLYGIDCQLYLTAEGEVSAEQTAIFIKFEV